MALGSVGFYMALAFTLFLPLLFAFILKKIRHPFPIAVLLILSFWWLFAFILPNILYLLSPTTPAIRGKVTDPAGKPLSGVNVKIAWNILDAGGSPRPYQVINMMSNEKGEFLIPKGYKSLTFCWGPPVFFEIFWGIKVIAYTNDFKFYEYEFVYNPFQYFLGRPEPKEVTKFRDPTKEYTITLQSFANDKEYLEAISNLNSSLTITNIPQFRLTLKEKEFIVNTHRLFEKKYPDSPVKEDMFHNLISIYNAYGNPKERIMIYQEFIEKFPSKAEYAKEEIKSLKKYHRIK